jgi:Protein of unknown function (DUF3014)
MPDARDFELFKTVEEPPSPDHGGRSIVVWIAAALLIVAIGAATYIVFGRRGSSTMTTDAGTAGKASPSSRAAQPLGGDAEAIDLPPLSDTDALVRDLVKGISSHPSVAAWLTTDHLIRNFTVVVANIAEGRSPSRHLTILRPSSSFRVQERGEELHIDPRSYERYNSLAAATASIDPAGGAKLYATLKPRIDDAYRELGAPDTPFDRTLERAIVVLLSTPVLDDAPRVEPRGIGFSFAAPGVEGLTPAQKQLLRAGPRNVRLIQTSLRNIALALGIPAERLPTQAAPDS